MFALMTEVDYEGQELLGIYSDMDRAMVAAQRYMEEQQHWGDEIQIFYYEVDAAAISTFNSSPVWKLRRS